MAASANFQGGEIEGEIGASRRRLEHRIAGLYELENHPRAVARELVSVSPDVGAGVIQSFHQNMEAPDARTAYLGLARLLLVERGLPYPLRESMYRIAKENEWHSVAMSLLQHFPMKQLPKGFHLEGLPPEGEKSLGERKSIARLHNRDSLSRLARDPHPDVVRHILGNPKVVEADILLIASARPGKEEVFDLLVKRPRWITSRRVQLALCSNPYCPTQIGVSLVPLLNRIDLQDLGEDSKIHPVVSEVARHLVKLRFSKKETDDE